MDVATSHFATSFAGEYLVPLLVLLSGSAIIGAFVALRHLFAFLREIKAQLIPNGGSSLRDSNDRTEAKVDAVTRKLDKHLKDAKKTQKEFDAMKAQWPFAGSTTH